MQEAFFMSLNAPALLGFGLYILVAIVCFALFQFIYTCITPHKEVKLIRENNVTAAIALSGAIIGFALPASNIIAYSISLLDFVLWTAIAAVVQLGTFFAAHLVIRDIAKRIQRNEVATGIYVAALAIAVGMLNAACMTPMA